MVLTTGRTLFVGDAAAACDVMTGEGIGQALLTGIRAAGGFSTPGAPTARRRGPLPATVLHATWWPTTACRPCWSGPCATARGPGRAVRVAGATDWTRRNFARWLFEDYPRAVAVTPGRWHRGVLSGPGAYRS